MVALQGHAGNILWTNPLETGEFTEYLERHILLNVLNLYLRSLFQKETWKFVHSDLLYDQEVAVLLGFMELYKLVFWSCVVCWGSIEDFNLYTTYSNLNSSAFYFGTVFGSTHVC